VALVAGLQLFLPFGFFCGGCPFHENWNLSDLALLALFDLLYLLDMFRAAKAHPGGS
jgi:hypothetical protein